MTLENTFTVPRTDAVKVLLDVERMSACMPGATVIEASGKQTRGTGTGRRRSRAPSSRPTGWSTSTPTSRSPVMLAGAAVRVLLVRRLRR